MELKKRTATNFETLLAGLKSKVLIIEVSITVLEDWSIEFTQSEQDGGNKLENKWTDPASGNFRTITKVPKFHIVRVPEKNSGDEKV